MQKGTPKTYLSSSRTKISLSYSPLHYDMDLKYQQEYLSKLKTQRLKAQKLYTEYKAVLKQRDKIKSQHQSLQRQYDQLKKREEMRGGEVSIELLKLKNKCQELQRQNIRLKTEQQQFSNNRWVYEKQVQQLEHAVKLAVQEDEYRRLRNEELEDQNRELEGMVSKYQREVGQLDQQIAQYESKCKQLQKELATEKDNYSKAKGAWQSQKQQLRQNNFTKNDEIRTLKHQLEQHVEQRDSKYMVEMQNIQLTWSIKLEEKSKEIISQRKNIDLLRQENKKLKIERDSWRQRQELQNSIKTSLEQLTIRLSSKESEYFEIQKKYISSLQQIKRLEARVRQLQSNLLKSQDSCRRKQQNCQEYLKIISKMEIAQERRKLMVQNQYDELIRMERIFHQ